MQNEYSGHLKRLAATTLASALIISFTSGFTGITNADAAQQIKQATDTQIAARAALTMSHVSRTALIDYNNTDHTVHSPYEGIAVSTADGALYVRSEPSEDAEVVGVLFPCAQAQILDEADGWTHIAANGIEGYASSGYLITDTDAEEFIAEQEPVIGEINTDDVHVRVEPDENTDFIAHLFAGETYAVGYIYGDWAMIYVSAQTTGYVPLEEINISYGTLPMESAACEDMMNERVAERLDIIAELEAAAEANRIAYEEAVAAAQKAAEEAAAAAKAESSSTSWGSGISATETEVRELAGLLMCEADGYTAQLAVASCVVNRVKTGHWGSSVHSVITAPNQFVSYSRVQEKMNNLSSEALQAARDALNGKNNIGSYLYFIWDQVADYSKYTSYLTVGDNVFYERTGW